MTKPERPGDADAFVAETQNASTGDREVEQDLLGALLANNDLLDACEGLSPEHFQEPAHKDLFEVIQTMVHGGELASPRTVLKHLHWEKAGAYVAALGVAGTTERSVRFYAKEVWDAWRRKRMVELCEEMTTWAKVPSRDRKVDDVLTDMQAELDLLARGGAVGGPEMIGAILERTLEDLDRRFKAGGGLMGLSTGLPDLDDVLGGLVDGNLIVLGGRPGMGKSALALWIAGHVTRALGVPSLFFSLEMTAEQLGLRTLAHLAELRYHALGRGNFTLEEFGRMTDLAHANKEVPIAIDATPGLKVEEIKARIRQAKRQFPVGLVVIDHLGKIRKPDMQSDVAAIGHVTGALAAVAKEARVPVLLLAQLNRGVDRRDDKRPEMIDLRGSGNIEEDADSIVFAYRPHYYAKTPPTDPAELDQWRADENVVELIVQKNRHGPAPKTLRVFADMKTGRFSGLA